MINREKAQEQTFRLLLQGVDTVQCAYYLEPGLNVTLDFHWLAAQKESVRHSQKIRPRPIKIGSEEFLLSPYGSSSGYPFVINNEHFKIEFGEFNAPNFYVTFPSQALWQDSCYILHKRFLKWAASLGFEQYKDESLSRVDFCFDYKIDQVDFNEDSFLTRSTKDNKYREHRKAQTFQFGKGNIVLRVYDKVAEIKEESRKAWFFILWEEKEKVWRIEWQVRKPILKEFGIATFQDLKERQGHLLRYLVEEHDTLKQPTEDSNRSRWPLHPLWQDLQEKIRSIEFLEVREVIGKNAALDERMMQMAISMYGYLKRVAAVECVQKDTDHATFNDAIVRISDLIYKHFYEPLAWKMDVEQRRKEILLGKW